MAGLTLKNIYKRYENSGKKKKKQQNDYAVKDLNLLCEQGEFIALLGPSGCGKSTLLNVLAGLHEASSGECYLDGKLIQGTGVERGVVFQQYALFPNMTVEQNIAVCLRKLERARRRARTAELVSMLRLEGTEKLLPAQLSGGQQQRTALARILASEPEAILLDEPFAALDSYLKWQLELELQEALASFAGPVIWVSHDRGEAYRNCGAVCVLDRGTSAPVTSLRELMTNPVTVSAARISGCKNYVPVRSGEAPGWVSVPDWGLALRAAAPWRAGVATLGICAGSVRPAGEETVNVFFCRVVRVTEDVSAALVTLRPENAAPGAPLLHMELRKELWTALPEGARIPVSVRPEDLLLLE